MYSHLNWECGLLLLLLLTSALEGQKITVEEGEDASLPCDYSSNEGQVPVCWGKGTCPLSQCHSLVLSTDGTIINYQTSSRYQLKGNFQHGDVSLTIEKVTLADGGTYCCRIQFPGPMNDKKINLDLAIKKAKVTPAPTRTLLGMPTTRGYHSETQNQTQVTLHHENQTVTQNYSLTAEVDPTGSRMRIIYVIYVGAGVSAGLLLLLIFAVLIFKCYSHGKEKLHNSSLVTSVNIAPSGLANMAAQGCRSEENIYIIEENAYEMEDPYAYYCSVIPEQPS